MISDEQIIEGCLAGKRKAYSMLYRKYASVMLGICMRYCQNRADAEDVLQEGFIKVFSSMGKYRHEGSFEGWIKRIMINSAIDHYQQNLRRIYRAAADDPDNYQQAGDLPGHDPDPPQPADIPQETLMGLIQELPDGYRMVFNLFAIEGLSHREIAESLGISENTSKTQLMKARRALRGKVNEYVQHHALNIQVP
jgi:RNA polymerase sigma-70 factor (ECF subfamily)